MVNKDHTILRFLIFRYEEPSLASGKALKTENLENLSGNLIPNHVRGKQVLFQRSSGFVKYSS